MSPERRPLILGYHAISSDWPVNIAVTAEELATHVSILRQRGYEGFTFSEAERRRRAGTLPPRSLVITFDDGFASVLRAREALAEAGFPGTVFVVTQHVESGEPLVWPDLVGWTKTHPEEFEPLSWRDLEALASEGWEIGSHTVTHLVLTTCDDARLEQELVESRATLSRVLGSCESIAYPYGVTDARVAAAAEDAGYLCACTLVHSHRNDSPFRRPRVGIARGDAGLRLGAKLSPEYLWVRRSPLALVVDRVRLARQGVTKMRF